MGTYIVHAQIWVFYTPEGRQLANSISLFINDGRYSNKPGKVIEAPTEGNIQSVLELPLQVTLTPDMTHLQLSRLFTTLRGKDGFSVWVYDHGVLVNGSPFPSYSDAHQSIGLPRTSRAIGRSLDTGKLYLSRYSFYSRKLLSS